MRLELRDVWAAPPGAPHPVLRGLSLVLESGQWLAIAGANGSGKSTLLHVAAGLLEPQRGSRLLSHPEGGSGLGPASPAGSEAAGPRIATVLQDPSVQLFAPTVAEEIALTALHLGLSPEEREAALRRWSRRFGLEADLEVSPRALSAGRQQLVLIAAALASSPDLLVADEPCAHLDAGARAAVLRAIEEERGRGLAILWATQNDEEWRAASRVASLADSGRLKEEAPNGPADRRLVGPPPAMPAPGEDSFLAIEVGPDSADHAGPRVRTANPFSLELPARGIVCFEGPNGVGKSVLLAASCGLIEVPQIRVRRGPAAAPPLLVGQYPETQIFEDEVGTELTFAVRARGVEPAAALAEAVACLGRLGLADAIPVGRHTWELSTGERRLVLLIAALIAPAGLLALDEPTAGLDPERRAGLGELIVQRSDSRLVLIASQDAGWVAGLPAHRVRLPPPQVPSSHSEKTD